MQKTHAVAIALILAVSAGLGLVAATRTAGLRSTPSATAAAPSRSIAARQHRLNRIEVALRRALRDKPPALPKVPAAPVRAPVTASAAPVQPRVVYHRPAPIVVVKHRAGGEGEHESEGGGDD